MTRCQQLLGVLVVLLGGFVLLGADESGCSDSVVVRTEELCQQSGGTWITECPPAALPPACGTDMSNSVMPAGCGTQPTCSCPAEAPHWVDGQGCSNCRCPNPTLPPTFRLEETANSALFGSGVTSLEVKSGSTNLGRIERKWASWGRTFDYVDAAGGLVATAAQDLLAWGARIDVYDCHKVKLGTINGETFNTGLSSSATFSILDGQGRKIGTSEEIALFNTDFYLKDMAGNRVAEMHRPWLSGGGDKWDVTIQDSQVIDPRLYIVMGAYKTTVDKERREDEERKKREQSKSD